MSPIPEWVRSIDRILMRTRAAPSMKIQPVALATIDEVQWVLLFAREPNMFCLIPQDEALREGNTLEIPYDHMVALAETEGTCVNRKKARALAKGLIDPAWEPRTYVMVGPDKEGYSYGLKMAELVAWAKVQLVELKKLMKEQSDAQAASQAPGPGGPVDAGRAAAPAPPGEPGASAAPG
jgi:hypothetical protein